MKVIIIIIIIAKPTITTSLTPTPTAPPSPTIARTVYECVCDQQSHHGCRVWSTAAVSLAAGATALGQRVVTLREHGD
jgi:hypothetical protein